MIALANSKLYFHDFYRNENGQMLVESNSKVYPMKDYRNYATYTEPSMVAGGQALAWVNKVNNHFHSIKLCSYSEYYDDFDAKCKPCGQEQRYSTLFGSQCEYCLEPKSNSSSNLSL